MAFKSNGIMFKPSSDWQSDLGWPMISILHIKTTNTQNKTVILIPTDMSGHRKDEIR